MTPLLSVQQLTFAYADQLVFQSLNFSAEAGEFIVLMGVNGAGKSTLVNVLAGQRLPASGRVVLAGRELSAWTASERSRVISHLPQGTKQQLPFTVEQVVLMGRYPYADQWFESEEDRESARQAMQRMGCLSLQYRPFSTLSGGEQQRVLLASCLAQRPKVMLLDEPSTYLDIHQQIQCFSVLADLAREGVLCIAVMHDLNLALAHCSRILVLDKGHLTADFATCDAATNAQWLSWLPSELSVFRMTDGRPRVFYK